jgi:hypothetical protein
MAQLPPGDRPSWLAPEVQMPATPTPPTPSAVPQTPAEVVQSWHRQPASRFSTNAYIAVGVVALLVLGTAGWVVHSAASSRPADDTGTVAAASPVPSAAAASPVPAAAPSPAPAATCDPYGACTGSENGPFSTGYRAYLSGVFQPETPIGGKSRATVMLLNKGQGIANLAIIFVTAPQSGYSNWWTLHRSIGLMQPTTCKLNSSLPGFVCGSVPANTSANVTMVGIATTPGTFQYAVKFADIAGGKTAYIDEHADGARDYVAWSEVVD